MLGDPNHPAHPDVELPPLRTWDVRIVGGDVKKIFAHNVDTDEGTLVFSVAKLLPNGKVIGQHSQGFGVGEWREFTETTPVVVDDPAPSIIH